LDLSIGDHLGSVSPDVEQSIYRIAQETLANIADHADASHLTVKLDRVDSQLILMISDVGKGFNFNESISARHLGIRGMRERAELIGGTLELKSQPGQGTMVTLSVEAGS
jgi:signal transduction histidine kinase